MSLWYCPECKSHVVVLGIIRSGIDLSCKCKVYHLPTIHLIDNDAETLEGIRKKTGWQFSWTVC